MGEYTATAVLSGEGYVTKTLHATLYIKGKEITGVTFTDKTVTYNGSEQSLLIEGELPQGVTVTYQNNKATDVGEYTATATLSGTGYQTLTLRATLIIKKIEITGVTFESTVFDYDGYQHEVLVRGEIPQGVEVVLTNDKATDAGEYEATAVLQGKNYLTKTMRATLTIRPAEMNVSLSDKTVEYDTQPKSLALTGTLPVGAIVTITYNGEAVSEVTEVGEYWVVMEIRCKNYVTKTLNAKLTIKGSEEALASTVFQGKVYFQNNLDSNALYCYSNGQLQKIGNDVAVAFAEAGNTLYYIKRGLLSSAICKLTTDGPEVLLSGVQAKYLVSDGTFLYFGVGNLVDSKAQNGVYRFQPGSNEDPVRLVQAKVKGMVYCNGSIWFINGDDGDKLYRADPNGSATAQVVTEQKVTEVVSDGNVLYYNKGNLLGRGIYRYSPSTQEEYCLSIDNGAYLTCLEEYVYYINQDLLTSTIFGKNICKTLANVMSDSSLSGEQLISAENNGFSSLTTDGTYLYYYKLNDKHLYRAAKNGEDETDLMQGFVAPDNASLTVNNFQHTQEHQGEIYFINSRDGNSLWKYQPQTGVKVCVVAGAVSDFGFYGNDLYYSGYVLTNFALWKVDLRDGETEKVLSNRADRLLIDHNTLYYIKVGSAYNEHLMKLDLSTLSVGEIKPEGTLLSKDPNLHVSCLQKVGDRLYYCSNKLIGGRKLCYYDLTTQEVKESSIKAEMFVSDGTYLYYYDSSAKALKRCALDFASVETIKPSMEINELMYESGKLFFSCTGEFAGIYSYDITTKQVKQLHNVAASGMLLAGERLYFNQSSSAYQNCYPLRATGSDGKFCFVRLDGTGFQVVAK